MEGGKIRRRKKNDKNSAFRSLYSVFEADFFIFNAQNTAELWTSAGNLWFNVLCHFLIASYLSFKNQAC